MQQALKKEMMKMKKPALLWTVTLSLLVALSAYPAFADLFCTDAQNADEALFITQAGDSVTLDFCNLDWSCAVHQVQHYQRSPGKAVEGYLRYNRVDNGGYQVVEIATRPGPDGVRSVLLDGGAPYACYPGTGR